MAKLNEEALKNNRKGPSQIIMPECNEPALFDEKLRDKYRKLSAQRDGAQKQMDVVSEKVIQRKRQLNWEALGEQSPYVSHDGNLSTPDEIRQQDAADADEKRKGKRVASMRDAIQNYLQFIVANNDVVHARLKQDSVERNTQADKEIYSFGYVIMFRARVHDGRTTSRPGYVRTQCAGIVIHNDDGTWSISESTRQAMLQGIKWGFPREEVVNELDEP